MIDPKNIKLEYCNGRPSVLRKATVWHELNFYKRSEILYQLTVAFCRRFLPKYGDPVASHINLTQRRREHRETRRKIDF